METVRVVTVTIGRNVGSVPMPLSRWVAFQSAVARALETVTSPESWTETHEGQGVWDGVAETSLKFSVLNATGADLAPVADTLAALAATYEQDAVALSDGTSMLVTRTSAHV